MNAWRAPLAAELGHPALFDAGVEAARNACVAGASIAAAAITAAAFYDNPLTGMPALRDCMRRLHALPESIASYCDALRRDVHPDTLDPDFSPGFGFVDEPQARAVLEAGARLATAAPGTHLRFVLRHHAAITPATGPLNGTGLAAFVCVDHGVDVETAEHEFLLMRMATAMAEAAGARRAGLAAFPFFSETYVYEGARPAPRRFDTAELLRRVGLE